MQKINEQIQNFFESEKIFRDLIGTRKLDLKTPLLELGILDSIGIFELITFLEARFPLHVESQDIVEANFCNIQSIENYVQKKLDSSDLKK